MQLVNRKLDGGGDAYFEKITATASMIGVDVIELLWIPRNRLPFFGTMQVAGYEIPVVSDDDISFDEEKHHEQWIDGTCKFYPDSKGYLYGYIYDTERNRDLLASSLTNNWFRIVDKQVREQIIELAKEKGWSTEPNAVTDIQIKISKREKEAEQHIKELKKKLEDMESKKNMFEKELAVTSGEKVEFVQKRLKGIKVPNRDQILEGEEPK